MDGLGRFTTPPGTLDRCRCCRRIGGFFSEFILDLVEGLSRSGMHDGQLKFRHEAPNDGIAVVRIQLQAVTAPPGFFGREQGRAAAAERVEHDAATIGTIEDNAGVGE